MARGGKKIFSKLRWSNKDVFFKHVRENKIYYYDSCDYRFPDIERFAKKNNVTIEKCFGNVFKVLSIPETTQTFKSELFDPEMLDVNGDVV